LLREPAPPLPAPANDANATPGPVLLNGLSVDETATLTAQVARHCGCPMPTAPVDLTPYQAPADEDHSVLPAVVARIGSTSLEAHAIQLLIHVNDGRMPSWAGREQWSPFMRLYHAIAVCHAYGAYVNQAVLPAITGLGFSSGMSLQDIATLLCAPGGGKTGLARQYLVGTFG